MTEHREKQDQPEPQDSPDVEAETLMDLDAPGDEADDVRGGFCLYNPITPTKKQA